MVGDARDNWPAVPAHLHMYVDSVDTIYERALAAGGASVQPPERKGDDPDRRGGGSRVGFKTFHKAGWSWGCVAAVDHQGQTMFVVDALRDDGKRFVVHAEEKLTAFLELESAINRLPQDEILKALQCCCPVTVQP